MKSIKILSSISVVMFASVGIYSYASIPVVKADNEEKITICHGAGQADTTHFETLTISRNAVYQDHGQGGHFYENGTPKAGHEQDYMGSCRSSDPSVQPSASPSIEPSANPSVVPSSTPTPTPNNNVSDNSNNTPSNNSSNNSGNTSSTPDGAVLGAYAQTGVAEDVMINALGSLGGLMTAVGSVLYGQKKTKRSH